MVLSHSFQICGPEIGIGVGILTTGSTSQFQVILWDGFRHSTRQPKRWMTHMNVDFLINGYVLLY